jgi:hypothetical protein
VREALESYMNLVRQRELEGYRFALLRYDILRCHFKKVKAPEEPLLLRDEAHGDT